MIDTNDLMIDTYKTHKFHQSKVSFVVRSTKCIRMMENMGLLGIIKINISVKNFQA